MDTLSWLFVSKVLIVLATVLLGIVSLAYALKKMGYGKGKESQSGGIKIKAQWHLNAKQKVMILHWPHGDLLLGISGEGIQVLDRYPAKKEASVKDMSPLVISEFKTRKTSGKH